MPIPGPLITIGIDGGYVRSWTDRSTNFEVIVGKSVPEEGPVRRFGFVAGHDEKPKHRLHELLIDQGIAMNQEVTFMSDGACNLRDRQYYMRPNAEHVIDYFHIAMRITVLQQMARGLPPPLSAAAPAAVAVLESVRRYLWHGNVGRALELIEDFGDGFDLIRDHHRKYASCAGISRSLAATSATTPGSFRIRAIGTAMARWFRPASSSRRSTR